jgi:hypothetical protein
VSEKRKCQGTTTVGEPCGAVPLKPGTVIDGVTVSGQWCRQHDEDLPSSAKLDRVRSPGQMGGRPRKPRAVDVLKEWMEANIDETLAPLKEGLSAMKSVVVGQGPTAHVETVPDVPTRMAAARELLDRGYGRPKQTVDAIVVTDEDLLERLALMEDEIADVRDSGETGDDPEVSGD